MWTVFWISRFHFRNLDWCDIYFLFNFLDYVLRLKAWCYIHHNFLKFFGLSARMLNDRCFSRLSRAKLSPDQLGFLNISMTLSNKSWYRNRCAITLAGIYQYTFEKKTFFVRSIFGDIFIPVWDDDLYVDARRFVCTEFDTPYELPPMVLVMDFGKVS